jgi:formylglycine-generating enzyme required for sulfatase activity
MRLGFLIASLLAVTASLALSQPSVEKIAHVAYVETVERDGVKATIDMVAIPGGTFVMGSPKDEVGRKDSEGPQHPVAVKPFWMAKYETTWAEYDLY